MLCLCLLYWYRIIIYCIICRENGSDDVTIKILYCGVCHSDLHSVKNDWGFTNYPVVPGYDFDLTRTFNTVLVI